MAHIKSENPGIKESIIIPIPDILITNKLIFRGNFEAMTLLIFGSIKSVRNIVNFKILTFF